MGLFVVIYILGFILTVIGYYNLSMEEDEEYLLKDLIVSIFIGLIPILNLSIIIIHFLNSDIWNKKLK